MNNSNSNSTDYFVTVKQYEVSRFVIYLICIPVISFCGIVGNSCSMYIIQKYPTKHAFIIYLKALTATDTCLLGMSLLQSMFKICVHLGMKNASKLETYAAFYAGIVLGSLLQRLSSAFVTVISVERLIAVTMPLKLRRMRIETRPKRVLAGLVCFFVVLQIPTLVVVEVKEYYIGNETRYLLSRTDLAKQQPELTAAYLFLIASVGIGLPLFVVIVSTCCIVLKMKNANKTVVKSRSCRGSIEMEKMTLTLVVLATFFSIMSLPALLIYIWTAFDRSIELTYLRALYVDISVALICINSGCDFIIYCMTSRKFRVLFFESVTCNCNTDEQQTEDDRLQAVETISRSTESSGRSVIYK